jgi:hypothetical protein
VRAFGQEIVGRIQHEADGGKIDHPEFVGDMLENFPDASNYLQTSQRHVTTLE